VTPLKSSVIESCGLISCEIISLDCVLLLMDTVNVSLGLERSHIECTELLFGTVYTTSVMKIIIRLRIRDVASH